jgi:ribosome-binding factor A
MGMNVKKHRVAEAIQNAISIILHRDIIDRRIGFVTITQVKIDDEYKSADVYYSVIGSQKVRERTAQGLSAANRFIQKKVVEMVKMGKTPTIRFKFDETPSKAERLEKQFQELDQDGKNKQDAGGSGDQEHQESPDPDSRES